MIAHLGGLHIPTPRMVLSSVYDAGIAGLPSDGHETWPREGYGSDAGLVHIPSHAGSPSGERLAASVAGGRAG
jgi:hypothetical protein